MKKKKDEKEQIERASRLKSNIKYFIEKNFGNSRSDLWRALFFYGTANPNLLSINPNLNLEILNEFPKIKSLDNDELLININKGQMSAYGVLYLTNRCYKKSDITKFTDILNDRQVLYLFEIEKGKDPEEFISRRELIKKEKNDYLVSCLEFLTKNGLSKKTIANIFGYNGPQGLNKLLSEISYSPSERTRNTAELNGQAIAYLHKLYLYKTLLDESVRTDIINFIKNNII